MSELLPPLSSKHCLVVEVEWGGVGWGAVGWGGWGVGLLSIMYGWPCVSVPYGLRHQVPTKDAKGCDCIATALGSNR